MAKWTNSKNLSKADKLGLVNHQVKSRANIHIILLWIALFSVVAFFLNK